MTEQTATEKTPDPAAVPGSDEYKAAMAARFRASQTADDDTGASQDAPADKPQRPEHVPEKFWNAETGSVNTEALLKSYTELEKTRGTTPAKKDEAPAGGLQIDDKTPAADDGQGDAAAILKAAGLDGDVLEQKIVSTGKLDEADYAALQKAGVPKPMVDVYVRAIHEAGKIIAGQRTNDAVTMIGGADKADALMKWAGESLPAEEKVRMNAMLSGPNWQDAVTILQAKHAAAAKTAGEPALVDGGKPSPGAAGYRSRAEMQRDMAKQEYKSDPAFRAQVRERVRTASWDLDVN